MPVIGDAVGRGVSVGLQVKASLGSRTLGGEPRFAAGAQRRDASACYRNRKELMAGSPSASLSSSAGAARQMTSALWRKPLIRRAAAMDCGLPWSLQMFLFRRRDGNAGSRNTTLEAGEITIRVVQASSESTVTVTGRVTVDSSPHLRSTILFLLHRRIEPAIVVDLSGVSYLDMSGLATLLEALKAARQRSKTLRVLGMTGQSRILAEIAELDKIFRSVGSTVEYR